MERAQIFYSHANPRKTHFEATAKVSVGLRDYRNDSTLAHIFSAMFEVKSTVHVCTRTQ